MFVPLLDTISCVKLTEFLLQVSPGNAMNWNFLFGGKLLKISTAYWHVMSHYTVQHTDVKHLDSHSLQIGIAAIFSLPADRGVTHETLFKKYLYLNTDKILFFFSL
jgi:hypothetical protein